MSRSRRNRVFRACGALLLWALNSPAADAAEPRRLTVTVELAESSGAWWQKALGGKGFDGVLLGWGLALLDSEGRVVALPPQSACPIDPTCLEWTRMGKCAHFIAQGLPEWDARYSCYADGRTIFLEQAQALADLEVPEGVREARLTLYFRDDDFRRKVWPSSVDGSAAAVMLRLDPEAGFALDVRLEIGIGPGGGPKDLRIRSCEPSGGDSDRIGEQMRSPAFRYCAVITVETGSP